MALTRKYIQLNPPKMKSFVIFDIDRPGAALAAEDGYLPPPSLTMINPANMHAHVVYVLKTPVCVSAAGRSAPQRYYEAVRRAYTERLGADPVYAGLIAKNPWHEAWQTIEDGNAVYELGELAKVVTLPNKPQKRDNPQGRNCTLFDTLRHWAYDAIRQYLAPGGEAAWHSVVLGEAVALNDFANPLPGQEIMHIARSVARWTWRHFAPVLQAEYIRETHTAEAQRARRAKLTQKQDVVKEQGIELMKQGKNNREIARALSVDVSTVKRWKNSLH
jgi:hypothetical protein